MTATLCALILAHVLADFALQPGWMVQRKRNPGVLVLHGAVVLALSQVALGQVAAVAVLVLATAHLAIDAAKVYLSRHGLTAFLADQAAHLVTILAVALYAPDLWASGFWAAYPALPPLMLLTAGLIFATRAGGFAIGLLMTAQAQATPPADGEPVETTAKEANSLPKGGLTIGLLERGLIYILILSGQPEATGFLIAAKSILRFGTVSEDRAASEYVIIGTLASFGWAIATALAVQYIIGLSPLEIAPATP